MPKVTEKTKKEVVKKIAGLCAPVYSLAGTSAGTVALPKEIFGVKVNKKLLAQAVRIYQNNKKSHSSNTKTRSEVNYSTKKMGPQKGSGHARHGSLGAPIYVGGGIALGPKYHKIMMSLPKKMKKAALISALSDKALEEEVMVVSSFESALGKTSQMQNLSNKLGKKNALIVIDKVNAKLQRATDNLHGWHIKTLGQLNLYEIISHRTLIFENAALKNLGSRVQSEKVEVVEESK